MHPYLTRHFAAKREPPPKRPLRRLWLLYLRSYYFWRYSRHLELSARSLRKRGEVIHALSLDDKERENGKTA